MEEDKEEERGNKRGEEKIRNELAPTLRQPYAPNVERGERGEREEREERGERGERR